MSDVDLDEHIIVVREGHGANCSSIGSVIDALFVTQVAAGALFAAVAAALANTNANADAHANANADANANANANAHTDADAKADK